MSELAKRGRPSRFNALTANAILERLVKGESVIEITRDPAMPGETTIFSWLATKREFQRDYARITEIRAHLYAERQLLVSLEAHDRDSAAAARVKADAYRWMAGRMLPKVYGDKMLHTGADGDGPVEIKLALDYSLLTLQEQTQMLALIEKATPRKLEAIAAPEIEGDASDVSDEE